MIIQADNVVGPGNGSMALATPPEIRRKMGGGEIFSTALAQFDGLILALAWVGCCFIDCNKLI